MTVPSTPSEIEYAGDGVTVAFPIPFPFDTSADIVIKATDSGGNVSDVSNLYTVTGGSGSTGTAIAGTAPASGITITILDDPEQSQDTDYVDNDAFPAAAHEGALDKLTRLVKRLSNRFGRTLRTADGDPITDLTLGSVDARKGKYLFFNAVTGAIEYAVAVATTTLSQSIIGQLLFPQTSGESSAGHLPESYQYLPGVDERRFGSDFPGDPVAVAKVLASAQEYEIPRMPILGSVAAGLRPMVSFEDRIVYVNASTGDDDNTGLVIGSPLATIQEAVNRCPLKLFHLYQIVLAAGTYDEDVLVTGVECFTRGTSEDFISENFQIVGAGVAPDDPAPYKVGSITAVGCHGLASVKAQGVELQRVSPYYEQAAAIEGFGSGELFVRNVAFVAAVGAASGAGILCYGMNGSLREVNCDNVTNGCWAKREALVNCSDFTGSPSAQTYRSEEASTIVVIEDASTTGTDPRDKYVTNGGVIRDLIGNMIMVGREFYIGMPKDASLALALVLGDDTVALGYNFHAPGDNSVLVGSEAEATGARNVVCGYDANATADDVIILATGVNVSTAGMALLGKPGTNYPVIGLRGAISAAAIPNSAAHLSISGSDLLIQVRDSGGTLRSYTLTPDP